MDHRVEEVSLMTAFERAQDYRDLGGELPTQDAAILRLLLAIIARAVAAKRSDESAQNTWGDWWEDQSLPLATIRSYLERFQDRFYLFHESAPFMQVNSLRTDSGKTSGLTKLIAEVPDGDKFFSLRLGSGLDSISFAEAARWLVHAHAFDTSGIKTGVVGDPRARGGRAYPMGTGYAGNLGLVIPQGANLQQTLLLNLHLWRCRPEDSAPWERDPDPVGQNPLHPVPVGMADLFTWQSRRIKLIQSQDDSARVIDTIITYGDAIRPENLSHLETMSAFKKSDNLSKREKRDIFWPVRHNPSRSIWRGMNSFVASNTKELTSKAPAVLEWLHSLRSNNLIDDRLLNLRTIGIEYGAQSSTVASLLDDQLQGHVSGFTSPQALNLALEATSLADAMGSAYARLGARLREAGGGDPKASNDHLYVAAYGALDPEFRTWFRALEGSALSLDDAANWEKAARTAILAAGKQLVQSLGSTTIRGRVSDSVPSGISRFGLLDANTIWTAFERDVFNLTPRASTVSTKEGIPA